MKHRYYINQSGPVLANTTPLRKWWRKFKHGRSIVTWTDQHGHRCMSRRGEYECHPYGILGAIEMLSQG